MMLADRLLSLAARVRSPGVGSIQLEIELTGFACEARRMESALGFLGATRSICRYIRIGTF